MTEDEIIVELARLHRAVEAKVRRQQRGELFTRVDECIDAINQAKESEK